jgi:hypothetical protein
VKLSIEGIELVKLNTSPVLVALNAPPEKLTVEFVLSMDVGKPEPLVPF